MCVICSQYELGKMTAKEAANAYVELINTDSSKQFEDHIDKFAEQLQINNQFEEFMDELLKESSEEDYV